MSRATLTTAVVLASVVLLASPHSEAQPQRCSTDSDCNGGLFCGRGARCIVIFCVPSPFWSPCGTDVCLEDEDRCVPPCSADSDCDDGLFCNGTEACIPGHEMADAVGCVRSNPPCLEGQRCLEEKAECTSICEFPLDEDGDGYDNYLCGGSDCDDEDPGRNPGNPEVCDEKNKDEDCNPRTFGDRDADRDGYVDNRCCNFDGAGESYCGTDCSDSFAIMNPGLLETCDGLDNDCNGFVDDRVSVEMYPDRDMDGFGDGREESQRVCPGTLYFSPYPNDCDDSNPAIVPGAIRCVDNEAEAVLVCGSDGNYIKEVCPVLTDSICITLPNGTGDCEPRKCVELP